MSANYILYESASGYGLFEVTNFDSLANSPDDITDVSRFGKSVKLAAFKPFTSAANALEQINAVSESQVRAGTRTSRRQKSACSPFLRIRRAFAPDRRLCLSSSVDISLT